VGGVVIHHEYDVLIFHILLIPPFFSGWQAGGAGIRMHLNGNVRERIEPGKQGFIMLRRLRIVRGDRDNGRKVMGADPPEMEV
jgi:hypothetical protein